MAIEGTLVKSTTGAHLNAVRDASGNLTTSPAFPTLAGGTQIALLSLSPTPNIATVATKLNEVISRVNAIIAATALTT